jgi:hypothetical protein
MYQEFSLDLGSSGISQEQRQPVTAGMEINFALESSRAGAMLTRKKGKKKRPRSGGFNGSSSSFGVQSGSPMSARLILVSTLWLPHKLHQTHFDWSLRFSWIRVQYSRGLSQTNNQRYLESPGTFYLNSW